MLASTRRGFLRALGIGAAVGGLPAGVVHGILTEPPDPEEAEFSEDEIEILRSIVRQLEAERISGRELIGYRVYSKSNRRAAGVTMEFGKR
jgi:hypothetical protein